MQHACVTKELDREVLLRSCGAYSRRNTTTAPVRYAVTTTSLCTLAPFETGTSLNVTEYGRAARNTERLNVLGR